MLLNLKYQGDDAYLEQGSAFRELFGTRSELEDLGDPVTGKIRLTRSGSVRIVKAVQPTSACPWPATCGCCNKQQKG